VSHVRVGIVGGGQLGRMLAMAGHDLGLSCVTLDPAKDSPAAQVAPALVGAYEDREALLELALQSDVVTYEFENVPAESTAFLVDRGLPVYPAPASLEAAQDRLTEKTLFTKIGLPVAPYAAVHDLGSLHEAIAAVGLPAVLKTRRLGYDGKGQGVIRHPELAEDVWRAVGEVPSILEAFVPFDRELSILAVSGLDGETRCWPLVENHHREGILRRSIAPAPGATPGMQADAERYARAVAEHLGHVGVLAIELFDRGGALLGNEMAPRVHNSGHWTIEGSDTSQFENHLRAVCGLPLGTTEMVGVAEMVNLIGEVPDLASLLAVPGARVHLYGKEPRPGRKLGHVTIRAEDEGISRERVLQMMRYVSDA
jgi:5-(carboxyamino)imidazole ribonucleotide synthase